MPSSVSASDRIRILEWFGDYRNQVRKKHPQWSTIFHPSQRRYVLEIRKINSDREVIATGEDLRTVCGEMMDYV